ncbi:MAG: hypothetical protein AAF738_07345 [Bacteroidota bacterium]
MQELEVQYKIKYIKEQLDFLIAKKQRSIVQLNFSLRSENIVMLTDTSRQKNGRG